ncbi:MAG: cytoplasmic protein [Deltaproteobacteria bacterium]|nr:cytoplasmic protein [Deltaproteobacteria bacterium]MBW1846421.1 cytoplasmic protein [Deltaproteobacteria bacterium]MBW2180194.1 cytoplasmic protein [Deltaproteobacteria bacterium]MBW2364001.1 cytoplasmic protein [Deltaproteobacteria bacterium]
MKKIALFAFNGDAVCFVHVLLNALDMNEKGYIVKIVIEGAAAKLIEILGQPDNPMHKHWQKVKELHLVEGVCKACASKMGTLQDAQSQGLTLLDDMSGHPGMGRYVDAGFEIITF